MRTAMSDKAGFTLVEIMIVVALIGLLAAIALPNIVRAREQSQANACINNLRQIDEAAQTWALETGQAATATVDFSNIQSYLKNAVVCPASGANGTFASSYTLTTVSNKPQCIIAPGKHIIPADTSN